jgi:hypothetical protein
MFDRLKAWWRRQSDADRDTAEERIDTMTAARGWDHFNQSEGGAIPPNYLPTGVDEGRPKK